MKKRITSLIVTVLVLVGTVGIGMSTYLRSEDPPLLGVNTGVSTLSLTSEDPPVLG